MRLLYFWTVATRAAQQVYGVPFFDTEAMPSSPPNVLVPLMSGFAQQAKRRSVAVCGRRYSRVTSASWSWGERRMSMGNLVHGPTG